MDTDNMAPVKDMAFAHEFIIWLSERNSAPTCRNYLEALCQIDEYASGELQQPLLVDEAVEHAFAIIDKLYAEGKLSKQEKKVAALFLAFLAQKKACEAGGDSYTTALLAPSRTAFERWLMTFIGLSTPSATAYAERIEEISSRLSALELSMYTVCSIRELKSWEPCLKNILDASRRAALDYYYAYLCYSIAHRPEETGCSRNEEAPAGDRSVVAPGFEGWCLAKEIGLPTIKQMQGFIESLPASCRELGIAFDAGGNNLAANTAALLDLYTCRHAYDTILTGVKEQNSIDRYCLYLLDSLPATELEAILNTPAENNWQSILVMDNMKEVGAKFRIWLMGIGYGTSNSTRTIVSSLYSCEELVRAQYGGSIMESANKRRITSLALQVSEHKNFNRNWRRPLRLFLQFLSSFNTISSKEHEQNLKRLEQIISSWFGGRLQAVDSAVCLALHETWEREFCQPLMYEAEDLLDIVKQITIHDEERGCYVLPTALLKQKTREKLYRNLKTILDGNCPVVDYTALLRQIPEANDSVSLDTLRQYLNLTGDGSFVCETKCIRAVDSSKRTDNFPTLVCNKLREIERPASTEELLMLLPGLSEDTLRRVLAQNNLGASIGIINPKKGNIFHADIIRLSETEKQAIEAAILEYLLSVNDFITVSQLHDMVKEETPEVLERHPFLSPDSLYKVLRYKLGEKFNFNLACVTFSEAADIQSRFQEFCAGKRRVTRAELTELKRELNVTNIPLDLIYKTHAHVDKDNFIVRGELHFDTRSTDEALEYLCREDFIPLSRFNEYEKLPPVAGFEWTPFLLEHYLSFHSEKFTYLKRHFAVSGCHGFIVRKASAAVDFDEAVAQHLCNANVVLDEESVLSHLRETGLIGRRTYSGIGDIIQRAGELNAGSAKRESAKSVIEARD